MLGGVWGVGPSTAHTLVQKYNINSIRELRIAARNGKVKLTHGQAIGLKHYEDLTERVPRDEVTKIRDFVLTKAQEICTNIKVVCTGSYRRGKSSCGDIDLLFCADSIETKISQIAFMKSLVKVLKRSRFLVDDLTETFECSYMGVCQLTARSSDDPSAKGGHRS